MSKLGPDTRMTAHGYLEVKNWGEFQHYKNRNPPWIKLHVRLLDDYEFSRLPDASKAHLMGIWILASKHGNRVPADPQWIATRIGATEIVDMEPLIASGFLTRLRRASDPIAERKQSADPETEREAEEKTEPEESTTTSADAVPKEPDWNFASCMGLVVKRLYFGNRPKPEVMAKNGSVLRNFAAVHGFERMARIIEGLARRRDRGDLYGVGTRDVVSLLWLNAKDMDLNQLAVSEDAFYRSEPSPRTGRGGTVGIGDIDIIGNIGRPA